MVAAVYCRKSTAQDGVADEQKSVTRQIEHARAYAASKGWSVDDAHIYVDDGISGAEFANRPGLLRLMNALTPRAPFQALVMSEESRLGREMVQTMGTLYRLITAGVRVFYYLEDKERTLDSPIEKVMMALESFGAELEKQKSSQRTHDALLRKAKAGHVTGGKTFGYTNVRTEAGPVIRVINEAEAAVVKEIFHRCARGQGFRTIAHALNAVGAPSPRAQQARPDGWCATSVREVLRRPLYRGEIVWNKTRKRNTWGQKQRQVKTAGEHVIVPAPQLRIVPEELWTAANERLRASRDSYLRTNRGTLWGKPANGIDSKYLLTGLLRCAVCGGTSDVVTRSHGKARAAFYGCATHRRKGPTVCSNDQLVVMEDANWMVLEAVQDELLDPVVITAALREAVAVLTAAPADVSSRREALLLREVELGSEIERLSAAIASGGEMAGLLAALKQREQERQRVIRQGQQLDAVSNATPGDVSRVEEELLVRVKEWRVLASRTVSQGRQILRKLLRGCVAMKPREDGRVTLSGQADYGKLFTGIPLAPSTSGHVPNGNGYLRVPFTRAFRAA